MRTAFLCCVLVSFVLLSVGLSGCSETPDTATAPPNPRTTSEASTTAGPDLVLTALSIDAWAPPLVTYSWTIKNVGDAPANLDGPTGANSDNVSVQAFMSMNLVFNDAGDVPAGGTIIGLSPLGNLDPGEEISGFNQSAVFGTGNICDYAYLILKCDWGQVVDEGDETNNTRAVLTGCGTPDLVLTEFSLDSRTSNSVTYSWTIKNIGTAPAVLEGPTGATADNVSVQAFLSNDLIHGNAGDSPAGGTVIGNSPIGNLDPDLSISGSFSSGTFADPCDFNYLILKCDWGEVVVELDETNNTLAAPILCVKIDIKPGSDENPVNPKSHGVIPVVICGSETFDVMDIDPASIVFGPDGAPEAHGTVHPADVNGDGYTDLMLHFRTQETGIHGGDTEACLSASLLGGGGSFTSCDHVTTVPMDAIAP